jgi:tetratricopeptide (TPR) repeat protein
MKSSRSTGSYDRNEILRRAERFRSRGRVRKAIREYEQVLAVDPHDVEVHTKIAQLYIRRGRKEEAKASLKQVTEWYEEQGFSDKEIATLRLAQRLDRRDLAVYLRLADLYLAKGLRADALRLLEGARRAFRRKRFFREAIAVEEKILSFVPSAFRAQVSLVRLLWKARRKHDAKELLWKMESQWALLKDRKRWRKARWLLFCHDPSFATCWGSFLSVFISPVPYRSKKRDRIAS